MTTAATPATPSTGTPANCTGRKVRSIEEFMAMSIPDFIAQYKRGVEHFDRRIFWLAPEQLDQAFLPEAGVGQWPIRVLLGHLADAELVFIHRMRRAVAEENPVVAVWDENAFIDSNIYGNAPGSSRAADARTSHPLAGHIALIHLLRQWGTDWLMTLTPEQWERKLMHPERGVQTVRKVAAYNAWHVEHHAEFLRKKLDRMGVEVPIGQGGPAKSQDGSCGSGCGCTTGANAPAAPANS